jgi:selenide, water dikinase
LDSVLAKLPPQTDANVLVGFNTADDAGVYQLAPDLALVQTVDFFTPIVDDPYTFGQIAATNALSDVYAMGGRPVTSLSIVGFPNREENLEVLEEIMRGGLAKMEEARCAVIGGHSIGDEEIKFGYAVTGLIDPRHILTNSAARVGDSLILTKRLGTGIIGTALKDGAASEEAVSAAVESMCTLNATASQIALGYRVHAMTDVTGFGLLGHAREMALGSKVSLVLQAESVEFFPGAVGFARAQHVPGGLKRNSDFVAECVEFSGEQPKEVRDLLFDPQTSGGLLMSVHAEDAGALAQDLEAHGVTARIIGEVVAKTHPLMRVT